MLLTAPGVNLHTVLLNFECPFVTRVDDSSHAGLYVTHDTTVVMYWTFPAHARWWWYGRWRQVRYALFERRIDR